MSQKVKQNIKEKWKTQEKSYTESNQEAQLLKVLKVFQRRKTEEKGSSKNNLFHYVNVPVSFIFNYILLIIRLQLSQFFPLCSPAHSIPHSRRQSSHHCSCPWVMHISSLITPFPKLYFTSPWLFVTTYLYFLIPSPLHSFPDTLSHLATFKTPSVSMVLFLSFLFASFIF